MPRIKLRFQIKQTKFQQSNRNEKVLKHNFSKYQVLKLYVLEQNLKAHFHSNFSEIIT